MQGPGLDLWFVYIGNFWRTKSSENAMFFNFNLISGEEGCRIWCASRHRAHWTFFSRQTPVRMRLYFYLYFKYWDQLVFWMSQQGWNLMGTIFSFHQKKIIEAYNIQRIAAKCGHLNANDCVSRFLAHAELHHIYFTGFHYYIIILLNERVWSEKNRQSVIVMQSACVEKGSNSAGCNRDA